MNSCEKYRNLIDDYLDEILEKEQVEKLEQHIGVCPNCRRELEQLQLIAMALRNMPAPQTPVELRLRVKEKIAAQLGKSFLVRWKEVFTINRLRLVGEAALVFIALFIGWQIFYSPKLQPTALRKMVQERPPAEEGKSLAPVKAEPQAGAPALKATPSPVLSPRALKSEFLQPEKEATLPKLKIRLRILPEGRIAELKMKQETQNISLEKPEVEPLQKIVRELGGKIHSFEQPAKPEGEKKILEAELPAEKISLFLERLRALNYEYESLSPATPPPSTGSFLLEIIGE